MRVCIYIDCLSIFFFFCKVNILLIMKSQYLLLHYFVHSFYAFVEGAKQLFDPKLLKNPPVLLVGLCWLETIGLQLWQPFFLRCLLFMCIREFFNKPICVANLKISSLSSSFSVCKSIVSSHISFISYDIIPLAWSLLSQWSPWPFNTLTNFEPNTRTMVTDVLNWVRMNPRVYLKFGPISGNRKKLNQNKFNKLAHNNK